MTWWEQMDNGKQLTHNRKFLVVVHVVLYVLSCFNFINTTFGSLLGKEQHGRMYAQRMILASQKYYTYSLIMQRTLVCNI